MATSGTATYSPDFGEIIQEAYERCGLDPQNGYDIKTAKRSLDLMSMEWANRGLNLWTVEQGSQALSASDESYTLPADTIDIIDAVIRTGSGTSQSDLYVQRMSSTTYAQIPSKNTTGRPVQYYIKRVSPPELILWPVPDSSSTYTFVYWRLRRMQDTGSGIGYTPDAPFRFIPALIAGLAYRLSIKKAPERAAALKQLYDEELQLAQDEDRDRASIRLVPGGF